MDFKLESCAIPHNLFPFFLKYWFYLLVRAVVIKWKISSLFSQEPVVESQCNWSAVLPLARENCGGTRKSWPTGYKHPHI